MSEEALPPDGAVHPRPATPPPPDPGQKSDLRARLGTAAVLVPLVLYAIYLGGLATLGLVMAITVLAQREFYGLIEDKGARPMVGLGLGFGAAVICVAYLGNEYIATLLMTASLLVLMVAQLRKAQITEALGSISGTFFGVFYVGWLLSHIVVLRNFYDVILTKSGEAAVAELAIQPDIGVFLVLFCLVSVVWCDAGAYFAGRAYGKRKTPWTDDELKQLPKGGK